MESRRRAPGARFRTVSFVTSLTATVLLGLLIVSVPLANASDVTIQLYGRFGSPTGWSLTPGSETDPGPALSVNHGDRVTMQLTSEDGAPHIFWIDYSGNGAINGGEPESPQFTGMILYTFDALQSGTFTYWCAIHKPSMQGTWVTNASTDSMPPTILAVAAIPPAQVPGGEVNITAEATDNVAVTGVSVHVVGPSLDANQTMTRLAASSFYLNGTFTRVGTYAFTVWARDEAGNFQSRQGSFDIVVPPPPGVDSRPFILLGALLAVTILAIGVLVWRRSRVRKGDPPPTTATEDVIHAPLIRAAGWTKGTPHMRSTTRPSGPS